MPAVLALALLVWLAPTVWTALRHPELTDDERAELVCQALRSFSAVALGLAVPFAIILVLLAAALAAAGPFCGVCGT